MTERDQMSFVEAFASAKLGRNARLEGLAARIDWSELAGLVRGLEPEGAGRPPFDPLVMLRALLLQQWYGLSDAGLEEALNDRVSFRRFVGLALDVDGPDHTTLCRFRNRLGAAGLAQRLFAAFDRQLEARGLVLKQGTMIDATLIEAARRRPRSGEEATVGDRDARFAKREGRPATYGYKGHVGVDQHTRLIRAAALTPANVADTSLGEALIRGDEKAVYADRGYASRARRAALRARGTKDRIMHKTWGGGPALTRWQKRRNALIAPRRAAVETIFAVLKRRMGWVRVRYVGLKRNAAHFLLLALAYNLRRAAALA